MILLIFSGRICAQEKGAVQGKVVELGGKQIAIPGVNIYLEGSTMGTQTDSLGRFHLRNIPFGRYKIVASMVGYKPSIEILDVDKQKWNESLNDEFVQSAIKYKNIIIAFKLNDLTDINSYIDDLTREINCTNKKSNSKNSKNSKKYFISQYFIELSQLFISGYYIHDYIHDNIHDIFLKHKDVYLFIVSDIIPKTNTYDILIKNALKEIEYSIN